MLDFTETDSIYKVIYGERSAILFASLARSILLVVWYLGMRRSGWLVYGLAIGITVLEGVLIISLSQFNTYGFVLGGLAIAWTILEGVFVWKTLSPRSANKMDDTRGLCFFLGYIHNILFLGLATLLSYVDGSDLVTVRNSLGEDTTGLAAPVIVLILSIIAGAWMFGLHFFRTRGWVIAFNAIVCNVLYFVGIVLVGELMVSDYMDSFKTGYYPYVALVAMIFQVLVSWSAARWAISINHEKRLAEEAITKDARVNPHTGSLWPINL